MRRTALALLAMLALGGCTSDDGTPSSSGPTAASSSTTTTAAPSPTAGPTVTTPPPAPTLGACYRLSYAEAIAPTSEDPPVSCDQGHTTQTFAVGTLDLVANGHLLAVDSDQVRSQVAERCPPALAAYVGATDEQLRLSLLRPVWFTPTIEQSDAGAGWYRCDVIAVTGDKTIAKLDSNIFEAFKKPQGRAAFGMCGTAQPGTATFTRVLCGSDHTWKAISVIDLDKVSRNGGYPGVARVKAAGQDACAEAARAIASDALDYEWGYEWPTKDQWQAGQTYGRCWSPDPP